MCIYFTAPAVRALTKRVTYSSSDSTVTQTSTSRSTATSVTWETTAETSKDTGRSSTLSTGDTSGTFQSEQSSNETDSQSTAESSSVSESDRNESNVGAGGSSSEHTKSSQSQQTSEVPASVTSESGLSEAVSGNVQVLESSLLDVASVGGDSGINELTSDMSNLSVAGEQLQQVSQSIPSSVSVQASVTNTEADEKPSQEPPALTQAKIVDNTKPMSSHSAVSQGAGDASGARPKIVSSREIPKPVFISLVYGNEPDPEPLSIFVNNPLMASQEEVIIAKERGRNQSGSQSTSGKPCYVLHGCISTAEGKNFSECVLVFVYCLSLNIV